MTYFEMHPCGIRTHTLAAWMVQLESYCENENDPNMNPLYVRAMPTLFPEIWNYNEVNPLLQVLLLIIGMSLPKANHCGH